MADEILQDTEQIQGFELKGYPVFFSTKQDLKTNEIKGPQKSSFI